MAEPLDTILRTLRRQAKRDGGRIDPLTGGALFRALVDRYGDEESFYASLAEGLGLWEGPEAVARACNQRRREQPVADFWGTGAEEAREVRECMRNTRREKAEL